MTKLVLAMIAVVIVACGEDDPYSSLDRHHGDEWRNDESCSILGETVTAKLWSEIADLNRSQRKEVLKEYRDAFNDMLGTPIGTNAKWKRNLTQLPRAVPCDEQCAMDMNTCLWWLYENAGPARLR